MAKKVFQSLKFTDGLMSDLKTLAEIKGISYNAYVEGILSNHVLVQKKAMRELAGKVVDSGGERSRVDAKPLLVEDSEKW